MAGSPIDEKLPRIALCAEHFRAARQHALARAYGLGLATPGPAFGGHISTAGAAPNTVIAAMRGGRTGVAPFVTRAGDRVTS